MKSRTPVVGPSPDERAQQDLEDMRAELLHEIQDGDEMEDERVEAASLQVARVRAGPYGPVACAAEGSGCAELARYGQVAGGGGRMGMVTISREFGAVSDDFGMAGFEREYETRPGFWRSLSGEQAQRRGAMVAMLNHVVQALAFHGDVVIQGRSGYAIFAGFADVLLVRLQAPLLARIDSIRVTRGLSYEEAAVAVAKGDEVRTAFVEGFYGVSWDAIHAFDLVINSAKIAADHALAMVVEIARIHAADLQPREPSIASIVVDSVLDKAVSRQLGCSLLHR